MELRFLKILSIIIIICFFILSACQKNNTRITDKKTKQKMIVQTVTVKRTTIKEIIRTSGDISGKEEAKVYASVTGKFYKKLKKEGDIVKKDEIIALINRDEEGLKYSHASVKSPIDGIITMYYVKIGDTIFPGQPLPVVSVANISNVIITVYIGEEDISKIQKGQEAIIYPDAYPDMKFSGILKEISAGLDPVSRKLKIEISVDNKDLLLKPGMFAKVEIITKVKKDVLVIPSESLIDNEWVFTVQNNTAKKVKVKTGLKTEENIEIERGLKENDIVITQGSYAVDDGTNVEIIKQEQTK